MSDTAAPTRYRLLAASGEGGSGREEWFDDLASAQAAMAARLGVTLVDLEALRRRLSADPVVLRRDDGRWRSRGVWIYRSPTRVGRLFEMIRVDEAQYDH